MGDGAMLMAIGWNYSIPICSVKQKSQPSDGWLWF
jgi:hypothetical protein